MSELRQVGKYVIEKEHRDGSLLARDPVLDRAVTLVVLGNDASEEDRARFGRQARAAAAIDHPNVVRVLETGEAEGRRFIAYEVALGPTLAESKGSPQMDRWLLEIAEALQAMHEVAIVHRAVTPENVRIASNGRAKLGGFALARSENAAPDSFRTRTMSGPIDNELADRVQWADMAIALGSPKIARIAKLARADRFETTSSMVDALDDDIERAGGTPIFLVAVIATLAIGGLGAYLVRPRFPSAASHTTRPPAPALLDASTDVPIVVDAAPEPVASASSDVDAAKRKSEPPPYTTIQWGETCLTKPEKQRAESRIAARVHAFIGCLKHLDDHGFTPTYAGMSLTLTTDGELWHPTPLYPEKIASSACMGRIISEAWPEFHAGCVNTMRADVLFFRGCYCPPDSTFDRPLCETCGR